MIRKFKTVFASVLMLAVLYPLQALAETSVPKKITDVAQLSYIDAQGNTELTTMLLVNTFTAALNSILSLKTGYQVKYDNEPSGGAEYADRIMALTLVVNFL